MLKYILFLFVYLIGFVIIRHRSLYRENQDYGCYYRTWKSSFNCSLLYLKRVAKEIFYL